MAEDEEVRVRENIMNTQFTMPRGVLGWAVCAIAGLVMAAGLGSYSWGAEPPRSLEAELAEIRASGLPLTLDEWERALLPVGEGEDAAPLYSAALDEDRAARGEKVYELLGKLGKLPTRTGPLPADLGGEIEQVLGADAAVLERLDRASACPRCSRVGLLTDGPAGTKRLLAVKGLARLTYLRTVYLARQGRAREAAESLIGALRMQRMFEREPALLVHLVRVACVALDADSVQTVLETGGLSDEELARVQSALGEADPGKDLGRVYAGELALAAERVRDPCAAHERIVGPNAPPELGVDPSIKALNPMDDPSYAEMARGLLRVHAQFAQAARQDWPEVMRAVERIPVPGRGSGGESAWVMVPSLRKSLELTGRTTGQVRSAQVAVMVERYRLAKKRLPGSLQELRDFIGHDLPVDPFTGKDLIYRVEANGYMVYSVGEDKRDDGGPEKARREDSGLVVRRLPGQ